MASFDQFQNEFGHGFGSFAGPGGKQTEAYFEPSRTLFLGDLSFFCTEEDLCTLFQPYGPIAAVRVRRGVTGESLLHGFIAFHTPEATVRAVQDLDGKEFMGRNMRVQLGTALHQTSHLDKERYVQLHVSFISKQLNFLITEKVLREIFCQFGRIADVTVKRHSRILKQRRQTGYGFVYYYDLEAAATAIKTLKHNTVREITFDCSISHKSGFPEPSPQASFMGQSHQGHSSYQGMSRMPMNMNPSAFPVEKPQHFNDMNMNVSGNMSLGMNKNLAGLPQSYGGNFQGSTPLDSRGFPFPSQSQSGAQNYIPQQMHQHQQFAQFQAQQPGHFKQNMNTQTFPRGFSLPEANRSGVSPSHRLRSYDPSDQFQRASYNPQQFETGDRFAAHRAAQGPADSLQQYYSQQQQPPQPVMSNKNGFFPSSDPILASHSTSNHDISRGLNFPPSASFYLSEREALPPHYQQQQQQPPHVAVGSRSSPPNEAIPLKNFEVTSHGFDYDGLLHSASSEATTADQFPSEGIFRGHSDSFGIPTIPYRKEEAISSLYDSKQKRQDNSIDDIIDPFDMNEVTHALQEEVERQESSQQAPARE